jgi:hypothetical protein
MTSSIQAVSEPCDQELFLIYSHMNILSPAVTGKETCCQIVSAVRVVFLLLYGGPNGLDRNPANVVCSDAVRRFFFMPLRAHYEQAAPLLRTYAGRRGFARLA